MITTIQNSYDNKTNFKAVKVLSAKTVEKGVKSSIEVFRLNSSDIPFAKRCLNVCYGKDRFLSENKDNIHTNSTSKEALKNFFNSFLNKNKGKYYIAVKDNSSITGVMHATECDWRETTSGLHPNFIKEMKINKRIITDNDSTTKTVLNNTFIEELKDVTECANVPSSSFMITAKVDDFVFTGTGFMGNRKVGLNFWKQQQEILRRETPHTVYETRFKDPNLKYNLANVLGLDA